MHTSVAKRHSLPCHTNKYFHVDPCFFGSIAVFIRKSYAKNKNTTIMTVITLGSTMLVVLLSLLPLKN
jgi:hypothetical protein